MNLAWIKLFLALLWLIPGVALLTLEWTTGQVIGIPVGGKQLPLAWPFILFGMFNLARWWVVRPTERRATPERERRLREPPTEPDPNFDFDQER